MHAAFCPFSLVLLVQAHALNSIPFSPPRFQRNALSSDHVQRRVKCHYFKTAPVGTYCLLLGRNGSITGEDVQKGCGDVGMTLLSSKTTPLDRVCCLISVFALKYRDIWWADELNETHLLKIDPCDWDLANANEAEEEKTEEEEKWKFLQGKLTALGWDCTFCNTAVICEAGFYHSNGSNCVRVEEHSGEVEYCYFKEGATASDSRSQCKRRFSQLMNAAVMNGTENLEYVRRLVRTDLEFWVDLKKEDVADLSGVIAFNAEENDWSTSCSTVWFGRNVPWFFRRNCNESYRIICQGVRKFSNYSQVYPNDKDCVYHKSNSRISGYCIPDNRTFRMTAGSEFCGNRSFVLLRGSALRELYDLYGEKNPQDRDTYVVWDEGFLEGWDGTSTTVNATILTDEMVKREMRSSLDPLGYICRQEKRRGCVPLGDRANLSTVLVRKTSINRPEICISQENMTFQESVNLCEALGIALLSKRGLFLYSNKNFLDDIHDQSFWFLFTQRNPPKCGVTRASILNLGDDCSKKHLAVCARPVRDCYVGYYLVDSVSPSFWRARMAITSSRSLEQILVQLNVVKNSVSTHRDIEALPYVLGRVLDHLNRLLIRLDEENRAAYTKRLGDTFVDIVEKTTLRSKLLKSIYPDERLEATSCLIRIPEDFAADKNLSQSR